MFGEENFLFLENISGPLIVFGLVVLVLLGAVYLLKKKRKAGAEGQQELPEDPLGNLKKISGRLPEKLLLHMKEAGIDLVPVIVKSWPELAPDIREQLQEFWEAQGYLDIFIQRLGAKNEEQCLEAAQVLMGLKNKNLLLSLIDTFTKPGQYVPARVADVILSYGAEAVPPLLRRLPELPLEAKCQVISILEEFGNRQAVPGILKELSHPSPQVRAKAVDALGELGDQEIAGNLISMMQDQDWGVRARAAKALGKIKASQARPVLEEALLDEAWWVRSNAKEALKRISH